ncbi:transcription initiation protein SPT3 homolog [Cryptotermes secundus]|uniref:transcription initiation protein SPT3 homolog n=1 Tax=Cryptotermes secundus TaxID=105785 RepID=UPI001454CCA3|nr:transcription initiation protein SPT3 homolog [Cryptotermes secundus]
MTGIIHSSEGVAGTDQPTNTKGYFVAEIQSMMYGFGDARSPLLESANLIETVVQQQQWAIVSQAADVAALRGAKCIGPEDILFLLRKDRIKTHRLLKYLGTSVLPPHRYEVPIFNFAISFVFHKICIIFLV